MPKEQIRLIVTIEIEAANAEIVDVELADVDSSLAVSRIDEEVPADVVRLIDEIAPPTLSSFQHEFAERCVFDLDLDLQRPSGSRTYVNGFPPKRYGSKRAVAFETKTGRAEIYCDPVHAEGRAHAEVVLNKGEPFAVKVYLQSSEAVEEALELTEIGLRER